jgi:hypothetical protein
MIFTHIILYRQNTYRYIQIHTNTCTHSLHPAGLPCVGTLIPSATPSWCSRSKCLGCKLSKIPSASCVYMYLHVCVCMCMSALWFFLSHWHRIDTYRYIQIHTDTYIYALYTYTIHTYTYKYIQLPLGSQIEETFHITENCFTAGTLCWMLSHWPASQSVCQSIIDPARRWRSRWQSGLEMKRRELEVATSKRHFISPLAHYVWCFPTGPPVCLSVSPSLTPAAAGGAGGSRASRWRDVNVKWPPRRDISFHSWHATSKCCGFRSDFRRLLGGFSPSSAISCIQYLTPCK